MANLNHPRKDQIDDREMEVKIMDGSARNDIRSLLKEFGVRADEAIVTHLARNRDIENLQVRLTLEDLTEYSESSPVPPLSLTVEGEITRQSSIR
ncbi:MAG: hypothetical protein A2Z14_08695 [Chloroflexi bacterium RBG_16_48_8]|nr:MAG: hypothetical protein A2Z14_08695 [Chloroflexi bacterium RBG_16_48_8]